MCWRLAVRPYYRAHSFVYPGVMTPTMLHPVMLAALEAERRTFPRSAQLAGMFALILGIVVLGITLG